MPIRIRWKSKENIGYAFMLLGACGLFQTVFILIGQYFLEVINYFVITIIPLGIIIALFFGSIILFESFAEVKRRKDLKSQFRKSRIKNDNLRKFLNFPITLPILITYSVFTLFFLIIYLILITFSSNFLSFLFSETIAAILFLLFANAVERNYAKIRRF